MRQFTPRYNDDNAELDKHERKMRAMFDNLPQWRQELARIKGVRAMHKRAQGRRAPDADRIRARREEVELEAAATLRKCADALQQALDAVNDTAVPQGNYQSSFNVRAVIDILFVMRKKMKV